MTREQLKQDLEPLEWQDIGPYDSKDIAAQTDPMRYWYVIFKNEEGYTVNREEALSVTVIDVKTNLKTLEDAKKAAWNDYVDQVLRLFKKEL